MSTMTAADLERSVDNLRAIIIQIRSDIDRLKADTALTEATLSHHKHDWRDVTSPPTTYTPATHTHPAYAPAEHTHPDKASSTHVHNYQDSQVAGASEDVSRTTGGPV